MTDPKQTKFVLDESKLPKSWYNIAADLPKPLPPVLHPGTLKPVGPDDLAQPQDLRPQRVGVGRQRGVVRHGGPPGPAVRDPQR